MSQRPSKIDGVAVSESSGKSLDAVAIRARS
jgi:hypothetical protein